MRYLRYFLMILALTAATFTTPAIGDAAYPSRPITLVVPYGAGGITDILGRLVAAGMNKELGVNVVVKNVVGAATTMGANEVATARPDGYTLGFFPSSTLTIQPHLLKNLEYSADTMIPIAQVMREYQVLLCSKNAPWTDYKTMFDEIKKNPGKYFYTSTASGNGPHIGQETLFRAIGLNVRMLPVKSGAEAIQAMYSGTGHFYTEYPSVARPNELWGVAIFGPERSPIMPDVPTFKELGVDVPYVFSWIVVFAPPKTPQHIIDALDAALKKVVHSKELAEGFSKMDTPVRYMAGSELKETILRESEEKGKLLRELGFVK